MILTLAALTFAVIDYPDCDPDPPATIDVAVREPQEHETWHGYQAQWRMKHGGTGAVQVLYLGGGKAAVVQEPHPLTLTAVARAIPAADRGPVYPMYMVNQARDWNECPAYVLSEWNCYLHNCAWDMVNDPQDLQWSIARTREFATYANTLLRLSREVPGYDATQMASVVGTLAKMTDALEGK